MAQTGGSQKSVTVSQKTFSLPQGWTVQVSKKYPDRVYYFNTVTGVATWNLSDVVQSSGTSKSKKKKKHSRRKKHDERLGNDQEQKQQHQQPIEIDDFDEEFDLDLTCPVEPEFDIGNSDMYGSEVSQQFESDLNRTNKKSPVDRPKRNKEKWKKMWDLPSGLKPEAKSSSSKEDCSISAEELQIIRFPKSNHIEGYSSIGVSSNVTEKTNLSQEPSATSLGTDTKMGNTFNQMRSVEDLSQAAVPSRQQSVSSLKDGKPKKPNSSLGKSSVEVEFESGKRTGGKQIIDLHSTENKCDKVQGKSGTIVEYKQGVKAYAAQGAKPVKTKTKPNSSAYAISPFIPRVLATSKSTSSDTFSQVTGETSEVNKCGGSTVSNVIYTGSVGPAVTVNALRTGQRPLGDSENVALNLQNLKNKSSASVGAHNKVSRSPGKGTSIDRKQDDASVSATLEWLAAAKASSNNKDLVAAQAIQDESKARRLKGKQKSHSDLTDSSQFESEGIPAQTCTASSFSSGIPAVAVSRLPQSVHNSDTSVYIGPHQLRQSEEPRSSAFSLVQPRSTHSTTSVPSTQGNLVNNRSRSQSPPLTSHDTLGHSGIGNRKHSSCLPSRWHQTPESESSVVSSVTSTQAESGSSVTLNQIHNAFPITPDSAREACVSSSAQEIDVDVAMEIDYDDLDTDQIMQDLQELRETIKPEAKAVGVLTESVQRTQTSRPITPVSALSSSPKRVYIVVDTNILISDLDFLQNLRDAVLKDYGRPYLIIPWMVLQELDGLKRSRGRGTYLVNQAFGRAVADAKLKSASIVNISSIVGKTGNLGQPNYSASKAGVIGLTKTAAKELARFNIRVNCVLPGFIETPMTDAVPDKVKSVVIFVTPLQRMGKPEEIADACVFLASEKSSYITGMALEVTGGLSM